MSPTVILFMSLTLTDDSKTSGQFHSLKGAVVETIGDMAGSKSWADSGRQEHTAGETEYNTARAKGYAEGTMDRLSGKKDAVIGAVTGDRQQEVAGVYLFHPLVNAGINRLIGNVQKDKGQTQQDLNSST
jgi:uncharacterized protein YjbJ (UPF0337 family)